MAYFEYKPFTPLFYYAPVEAFENIVRSKTLWLTDITASNDPREIRLGLQMLSEAMNGLTDDDVKDIDKREVASFLADIHRFQRVSTCYGVCFGLAGDELPMWREYAGTYTGVSIAFRPTAMNAIPGRMQQVRYTDETTAATLKSAAVQAVLNMGRAKTLERSLSAAEAFSTITALKHRTWLYEREVRMIFNQRDIKPDPQEILTKLVSEHPDGKMVEWREPLRRQSRGKEVQYFEFPYGRYTKGGPDPRRAIDHVVLGPKCLMTVEEVTALLTSEGFGAFSVVRSECEIQ